MKTELRIASLLLTLLLLASLCGCSLPGIGDESGKPTAAESPSTDSNLTAATTVSEDTSAYVDHSGYFFSDPVEYVYFNGETVKILAWGDASFDEFAIGFDDAEGDTLSGALYKRNITVEETIGVNLEFVYQNGGTANAAAWNTYLKNCVNARLSEYDIIAASSIAVAKNAVTGLLTDLLDSEDAQDFNEPKWSPSFINDALIGSSLYFATGSHSSNWLLSLYVCYANTDHIKFVFGTEDPFRLVESGEWTLEKFLELSQGVYFDYNVIGTKDHNGVSGDFFGYVTSKTRLDAWLYAVDAKYCEIDEGGKITASDSLLTDKVESTASRLANLLTLTNDGFLAGSVTLPSAVFASGGAIFMTDTLGTALNQYMTGSETLNYTILPMPKYDLAQETYLSTAQSGYTLYAIPADAPDRERASAVLQTYAKAGYRHVTSAVFREVFGSEYSNDSESACFDIVKENFVYDHGCLFAEELIGQNTAFREAISEGGNGFLLRFNRFESLFARNLEALNSTFERQE